MNARMEGSGDDAPVIVRFAPSPTGHIHIGNVRTALFNWLFARRERGRFILRLDDTDAARSTRAFAKAIREDLDWLGLTPHETVRQSDRFDAYGSAVERLKSAGLVYPCYETGEELDRRRRLRRARRLPPVYDRAALKLTGAARAALEAEGRKPYWRFLLPNFAETPFETRRTDIRWNDLVSGPKTADLASISDPVLIRADGTYLYTLPSVVDDIALGVSHVIRGDDHVVNTGVQIALFRALGADPPAFDHHNLLTAATGGELSKRSGALSVRALRESGFEPMAVNSLAALVGTSISVAAMASMRELERVFRPELASGSAAKFDPETLAALNRAIVHDLDYADVAARLSALGVDGPKAQALWLAVRRNVDFVADAARWWAIVEQGPRPGEGLDEADMAFVRAAFDLLPPEPWNRKTWRVWTDRVKMATGREGRALFMPLRIALTGLAAGPELADLLPLIGRAGTVSRQP